jgi:hypothetical protein
MYSASALLIFFAGIQKEVFWVSWNALLFGLNRRGSGLLLIGVFVVEVKNLPYVKVKELPREPVEVKLMAASQINHKEPQSTRHNKVSD